MVCCAQQYTINVLQRRRPYMTLLVSLPIGVLCAKKMVNPQSTYSLIVILLNLFGIISFLDWEDLRFGRMLSKLLFCNRVVEGMTRLSRCFGRACFIGLYGAFGKKGISVYLKTDLDLRERWLMLSLVKWAAGCWSRRSSKVFLSHFFL